MKLRLDPITGIILAVLIGWGWNQATSKPICQVEETHNGKTVLVPKYCEDVLDK